MSENTATTLPFRSLRTDSGAQPRAAAARKQISRGQRRHRAIIFSGLLILVLPLTLIALYLFFVADDQYASKTGFVVRQSDKNTGSPLDFLGGLGGLTNGSSADSNILHEFIQSQRMVELVDQELDLKAIYSRPVFDPVFAFDPDGSIEDLQRYWSRMVRTHFDSATGLLDLRVLAFTSEDATRIAEEIVRQSSIKINELSAIARNDATRYAREDLEKTVATLKTARQAMTEFRNRNRIVDPKADIQVQMGLISTMQTQLAESMIELDMLKLATRMDDPRIQQVEQRVKVIQARIDAERGKIGVTSADGSEAFSEILADFERLTVDQQFAEQAYVTALATYDGALAEANRQSRYLATYIEPTRAETSGYPRRLTLIALSALFLGLAWAIGSLILYSVWDRR